MEDPEQTHSDDMNVLNYLLRTVRGLRAVSTEDISSSMDEELTID
jgi:hypothetical protein